MRHSWIALRKHHTVEELNAMGILERYQWLEPLHEVYQQ